MTDDSWGAAFRNLARRIPHLLGVTGVFIVLWAVFPADGCGVRELVTFQRERCDGGGVALRAVLLGLGAAALWTVGELSIWKTRRRKQVCGE